LEKEILRYNEGREERNRMKNRTEEGSTLAETAEDILGAGS